MAAIDCLIITSDSEGFPNAVAEAWLAGTPVVSTPVGAGRAGVRLTGEGGLAAVS